jgi:hypothetical protein
MATNWIIPTADDVAKVISLEVLAKSNENIDGDSITAALASPETRRTYDPTLDDRCTAQIVFAVNQLRAAIQLNAKIPLSITPNAVPPEALRHVLYLAAYGLVNSTPNLQMVILSDKGAYSPLTDNFKIANKYFEDITKGKPVVPPTDPTGRDYLTAVNVPWFGDPACNPFPLYDSTKPMNPPVASVRFGASSPPVDLTTYNSIFQAPAPWWWPGNLGMP